MDYSAHYLQNEERLEHKNNDLTMNSLGLSTHMESQLHEILQQLSFAYLDAEE